MSERDKGKEKLLPFSGRLRIRQKTNGLVFERKIEIIPDGYLNKILMAEKGRGEKRISAEIRVDSDINGFSPSLVLANSDGREILYQLKRRVSRKTGEKYYSLSAPPSDILNNHKATKADFTVAIF